MKDFYTQCMKDLYALTGIEQVRWMLMDLKEGERNFDLCIEGMVQTSKQFSYIPDADQQKIIRKMMIEDKDYEGLNSRTVFKWLSMHKEIYWQSQSDYKEIETEPVAPEIADRYIEEWKKSVSNIGSLTPRPDGIKGGHVRQLKDKFAKLECKHPAWMYFSDTEEICNDCGERRKTITLQGEELETPK